MDDHDIDLRSILGLLRRQIRLIAIVAALVLVSAAGIMLTFKPVYTASTLILVDPSRKDLLDPDAQMQAGGSESARVESEVELVKSEPTLIRVIDELGLINDTEFGVSLSLTDRLLAFARIRSPELPSGEAALQKVLAKLRDAVSAQRRGLTFLIAVSTRSASPETAAKISNAVASAYIRKQLEAKVTSTLASRDIINDQIEQSQDAVSTTEQAFDTFIEQTIDDITRDTGRTDLAALRDQLEQASADSARLASDAETVSASLNRRDWIAVTQRLQSEALTALEQQRTRLEASLTGATRGSQEAIDLSSELQQIEEQMLATASGELTGLRQQVTASQSRTTDLRAQLRSNVLAADLPAATLTGMYGLQQNAEIARLQYQTLLSRLTELNTQAALQVPDSRIVSEALPPGEPSFPNARVILAVAGVVAVALGIGVAVLADNFVGGFLTGDQVRALLRLPAISVPRRTGKTGDAQQLSIADLVVAAPLSAFAEAIRRIRIQADSTKLKSSQRKPGGTVIMVTSSAPDEGKTTIALALARTYAIAGHSTLLIDCDLRKPSVHRQLGLEPSTGLLEYLSGTEQATSKFVTVDKPSGAHVVVGARHSDYPTDQLLIGNSFGRLLAEARDNFEYVILDTPPIGPVVDGLYLAKSADVVLFVVRWAHTSQQESKAAVQTLREMMAPEGSLLAVLNQEERGATSYRYQYARYYSD